MERNIKNLIGTAAVLLMAGIGASGCEYATMAKDAAAGAAKSEGSVLEPASAESATESVAVDGRIKDLEERIERLREELAGADDGDEINARIDRLEDEVERLKAGSRPEPVDGYHCSWKLAQVRSLLNQCRLAAGFSAVVFEPEEVESCAASLAAANAELNRCLTSFPFEEPAAGEDTPDIEIKPIPPAERLKEHLGDGLSRLPINPRISEIAGEDTPDMEIKPVADEKLKERLGSSVSRLPINPRISEIAGDSAGDDCPPVREGEISFCRLVTR